MPLDAEYTYNSVPADVAATDLGLVHPMTGPVHINGAKRGDAIEVEIVDIVPDEYGYTVIVPGFGFMHDVFTEPAIIHWQLTRIGAVSCGNARNHGTLRSFSGVNWSPSGYAGNLQDKET